MHAQNTLSDVKKRLLDYFNAERENYLHAAFQELQIEIEQGNDARDLPFQLQVKLQSNWGRFLQQWSEQFDYQIEKAIENAYQTFNRPSLLSTDLNVSLIEHEDYEQRLRFNEALKLMAQAGEPELSSCTRRIANLFLQDDARERENPFRPYIWLHSLVRTLMALQFGTQFHALAVQVFARALNANLPTIYLFINNALDSIVKSEQGAQQDSRSQENNHSNEVELESKTLFHSDKLRDVASSELLFHWLHQALLNQNNEIHAPEQRQIETKKIAAAFSASAPPRLRLRVRIAGEMHKKFPCEAQSMSHELINEVLIHREKLRALCDTQEEKFAIDTIALLIEGIWHDLEIPRDLRVHLVSMQFLLLQVSWLNEDFFVQPQHPAHQLVEYMINSRIVATQFLHDPIRIIEEADRLMKMLSRHDCSIPELFLRVITRFESVIQREMRHATPLVHKTVKTIQLTEARALRVHNIRLAMQEKLSEFPVPDFVCAILYDPWVHLIERAERSDLMLAHAFRTCVADLIWSLLPKTDASQRSQLADVRPAVLSRLQEGLQLMNFSEEKIDHFFELLATSHSRAWRGLGYLPGQAIWKREQVSQQLSGFIRQGAHMSVLDTRDLGPATFSMLTNTFAEIGLDSSSLQHEWQIDTTAPDCPFNHDEFEALSHTILAVGNQIILSQGNRKEIALICWSSSNRAVWVLLSTTRSNPIILNAHAIYQLFKQNKLTPYLEKTYIGRSIDAMIHATQVLVPQALIS